MCGLEPPADWDGRTVASVNIEKMETMDFLRDSDGQESYYGGDEEATLRQRLTELGYFE
jgi:hypothetical protein